MGSRVDRFEDLIAWQKARKLVRDIYTVTRRRPFSTDFSFRDQMRRAAVSIPSNIAEGFERARRAEFHQFLSVAKGSCAELRTQLYIAFDVEYISERALQVLLERAEEVARVIGGLRASIATRRNRTQYSALSTQH
jgi:four helix bundle protein